MLRDTYPPFRPDVAVLLGQELPARGIFTDLLAARDPSRPDTGWTGGRVRAVCLPGPKWFVYLCLPLIDFPVLRWARHADLIQARDRIRAGLLGLFTARLYRKPFVYWMSFPIAEGHRLRAREIGQLNTNRMRKLAATMRASLATRVEDWVIQRADHLFVQSWAMRTALANKGIPANRMTVVPMGIDTGRFNQKAIQPLRDRALSGRKVLVYLGTTGRARATEFLLDLAHQLRTERPEVLLLLVGDCPNDDDRLWLRSEIANRDLKDHVHLTGWLSQADALRWAASAQIGLSPIPRGTLFDVSSPTKVGEYLAIGLPCVANDIPDQEFVLRQSGGGICVPMQLNAFKNAVIDLLEQPDKAAAMGARGRRWILKHRSYERIADEVAQAYFRIAGAPKKNAISAQASSP